MDRDQIVHEKTEIFFPLSRFLHWKVSTYFPFGNTPAEDLLENCGDTSLPSVLCLGCGDLRSCFYTLWKHFDPNIFTAPKSFNGVRFTLNDSVAAILARNIIFLYMCVKLPEEKEERKKWLCAMWAIWYSLELDVYHLEKLNLILVELISLSESLRKWSRKNNPLHSIVKFTSSSSLSEVSSMWNQWIGTSPDLQTKEEIYKSRKEVQNLFITKNIEQHCVDLSISNTLIYPDKKQDSLKKISIQVLEVQDYLNTGCCFAELAFDQVVPAKERTKLNPTMIQRKDWIYNCHYGLLPFEGYYHTVKFTPSELGLGERNNFYNLFVPEESFKLKPFLANSVQQFFMWIQSSNRALKNKKISISFCFDVQHCLTLCQQHNKIIQSDGGTKYDVITTSNLMDHLSPSNLIVACTPLLQDNGALLTSSMNSRCCANTGEELLNLYFGFNIQLFPVILGVRCISHEGSEYSNKVKINPSPPDLSHQECLPRFRTFIWVKETNAQLFVLPRLPETVEGNITNAFLDILHSYTYSLFNNGHGDTAIVLSHNCIETAIGILKVFLNLSQNSVPPFPYWEPLCIKLRNLTGLYLHCLQTQFLLHNIHVHLTVSERTCIKCQRKSLKDSVGIFCAGIPKDYPTSFFMALIHKCSIQNDDLQKKALEGKDVHIFDCFDGIYKNDNIALIFYAPLIFLNQKYRVTIVSIDRTREKDQMKIHNSCELSEYYYPKLPYRHNFNSVSPTSKSRSSSDLGIVYRHICDGNRSTTEFFLSEIALEYVKTSELKRSKKSSRQITLHCQDLKYDLHFNFPIDYSSLKITPEVEGRVLITCKRQPYSLKEERPCFIATPDHMISLPVFALDPYYLTSHGNTKIIVQKFKTFFQSLFNLVLEFFFFCIHTAGGACKCLILVNNVLFDYRHKTPAIDLAYSFVEGLDNSTITSKWNDIVDISKNQDITVDKESLDILREVLCYFACRTKGTLTSAEKNSRYCILHQSNLGSKFTRAVTYSLLRDPDKVFNGAGNPFDLSALNIKPVVVDSSGSVSSKSVSASSISASVSSTSASVSFTSASFSSTSASVSSTSASVSSTSASVSSTSASVSSTSASVSSTSASVSSTSASVNSTSASVGSTSASANSTSASVSSALGTTAETIKQRILEAEGCSHCHNTSKPSKKCTGCRKVQYCCIKCQSNDWARHQLACNWQKHGPTSSSGSTPISTSSIGSTSLDPVSSNPSSANSTSASLTPANRVPSSSVD